MDEPAPVDGEQESLWRNRDFVRFWSAQVVSKVGSAISGVALPVTAVYVLGASPTQMSLFEITRRIPNLLFDLFAGVWVDRTRRRPILIGADLGRALLLGTIPLAALLGYLTLAQLYVVAFLVGTLTAFFSIASISILPSLVRREQLVEANSKLTISDSVITVAGPSFAGVLVQLVSAPKAIVVDSVSYVLSALSLRGVGLSERPLGRARGRIWSEIGEGAREMVRTPVLRWLAVTVSVGTFGVAIGQPVSLLFLKNDLGFEPVLIGLVSACGGVGSLLGALLAGRVVRFLGIGRAIVFGNFLWAAGDLILPFAGLSGISVAFIFVGTGKALGEFGATVWGVNQMSLRQTITPVGLFGRATAARRFLMFSVQITGAALGGVLGNTIGLRATLFVGAAGLIAGSLLLLLSPVADVHDLPHPDNAT